MSESLTSKTVVALRAFFAEDPAAKSALFCLRQGVEIGVELLDGTSGMNTKCAILIDRAANVIHFEARPALRSACDFSFSMKCETAMSLAERRGLSVGEIGISIAQEVMRGNIRIRFHGSAIGLLRNGYFEVLQKGGAEFWRFLSVRGFGSISAVAAAVKKMRAS